MTDFSCSLAGIPKKPLRHIILIGASCIIILWLMILQIYSQQIAGLPSDENSPGTPESATPESATPEPILLPQPDPSQYKDPRYIDDFCNLLPKAPKHPREILIAHKKADVPLKVFIWRQITYFDDGSTDWSKESQRLCPFTPELQPFFDYYRAAHAAGRGAPVWPPGYAPCFLWEKNVPEWDRNKVKGCGTNSLSYISSSNYTEFRDADIIFIDYPFYNYIDRAPFWEIRRMPPRLSHQRWVLEYGRESIAHYSHVALPSFLQQFDFTMGAPAPLFDVPYPLLPVSEEMAQKYTNVKPAYPFDKTPDNYIAFVISNCSPKNDRNELITDLIKKIGAHSYGKCQNNQVMPKDDTRPWEEVKQEVLAKYPFTLVVENSNCIGYVTEKIYDALAVGVIPLYEGASDISDYVPKGSYVPLENFKNTDELVAFMKTVDRSQYFKWKDEVKGDYTKFCKSCHSGKETVECRILDHVHYV